MNFIFLTFEQKRLESKSLLVKRQIDLKFVSPRVCSLLHVNTVDYCALVNLTSIIKLSKLNNHNVVNNELDQVSPNSLAALSTSRHTNFDKSQQSKTGLNQYSDMMKQYSISDDSDQMTRSEKKFFFNKFAKFFRTSNFELLH